MDLRRCDMLPDVRDGRPQRRSSFNGSLVRMRLLFLVISCLGLPIATARAEPLTYNIDYAHSEVRFSWEHWGLSTQHAEFTHFTGDLVLDHDAIATSHVNATIDMTSLN